MRFAYYPGCVSEGIAKENLTATKKIAARLGIELVPFDEFACCGAANINEVNPNFNLAVNARNFAIAEQNSLTILTLCSTCLYVMRRAKCELDNNAELREKINKELKLFGLEYKGKVNITHLLWELNSNWAIKRIKQNLKNPLNMRVAPFYGCHSLRPSKYLGFDNANNPHSFERLIRVLGGTPVNYKSRTKCCGFHTFLTNRGPSLQMNRENIKDAAHCNTDVIATPCPLCYVQLSIHQDESMFPQKKAIPVLHLSQLVGLALGFSRLELGIKES